jgi:hypothetical protein
MTDATLVFAVSAAAGARTGLGGGLMPEDVSPGVIGFLVTLALVLACIPLFRSMTGKLRGVQHRALPEEAAADDASDDRALHHDGSAPSENTADDDASDDHPPRHASVSPADDERPGPAAG